MGVRWGAEEWGLCRDRRGFMGLTGREGEIRSRNPRQEGDASNRDNGGVVVMVHVAVMAMLLMMPEMVMTLAITTV